MYGSEANTRGIKVKVRSQYVPERSRPDQDEWFFIYTVNISNESEKTVQLISRHWIITDADGKSQEVIGDGVVGEQPVLRPGYGFEYTSACPLNSSFGSMHGTYKMKASDGEEFDAAIAHFSLATPHAIN